MRHILKCLALSAGFVVAVLPASSAMAQDAEYVAPADELAEAMAIMEAMFPADTREQMMLDIASTVGNQAAAAMMSDPVFQDPGIRAIMDEFLEKLPELLRPALSANLPAMIDATAVAYTREFTLEELRDINAFASTPSGRRYFANAQTIMSDPIVAAANQQFFAQVSVIQQEEALRVQTKVQEYLQANPDVLERLQNEASNQGG